MSNNPPSTTPLHVVLVVIYSLAILSLLGFVGTWILVREKMDGASIAVFSGLTGMVVGGLLSTLNNTRTPSTPSSPEPSSPDSGNPQPTVNQSQPTNP